MDLFTSRVAGYSSSYKFVQAPADPPAFAYSYLNASIGFNRDALYAG